MSYSSIVSSAGVIAVRGSTLGNVAVAGGIINGTVHNGTTFATGDLVLFKEQTLSSQNGIYVVPLSGTAARSSKMGSSTDASGSQVFVQTGGASGATFVQTANPALVGTNNLVFAALGQGSLSEVGGQTFTGGTWSSGSFTALSSTVPSTGSQVTLPIAGTWLVTGQFDVSVGTIGTYQARLFNVTSGLQVGQSAYMTSSTVSTPQVGVATINAQIVTVAAGTVIRLEATSNNGTASAPSGGSIYYQKIGGLASSVGQTADSLSISKAGVWTATGLQTFGVPTGSGNDLTSITNCSALDMSTPTIVFNTGAFTLTALGLTCVRAGRYNFKYSVTLNSSSAAAVTDTFFTKNSLFTNKYALASSRQFAAANTNPETTTSFFTDTCVVGDTYQLRIADTNTNAVGFISAYAIDVQQVGTSAIVGIAAPSTTRVTASAAISVSTGQSVVVLVDASSAPVTITLPLASASSNATVQVKKVDSSANLVTVARSGTDTIDGLASYTGLSAQYKAVGFAADSSNSFWGIY